MIRALRRDCDLVLLALIGCALIFVLFQLGGCASQLEPFRNNGTPVPDRTGTDPIGTLGGQLGWLSWVCLLLGVGGVIASYVPTIGAFVPRNTAVVAFFTGIGLAFVRAWVETLGKPLVWISFALTVIGLVLALYPYGKGLWAYVRSTRRNQPGSDVVAPTEGQP